MNSDLRLDDNSKIAVIGGGPSGSLFSFFALKMAKMIDKNIEVTIFEPKDFTSKGPVGCNRCGGVISEHLVQTFAVEGINIPTEVVQRSINSYVLHTQSGSVFIESPSSEKSIATVYRGGGPKGLIEHDIFSFDNYLLQSALKEGATHVPLKIDGIVNKDKPVLMSGGKDIMEADLVVGAFGVNTGSGEMFEDLIPGYRRPKTTKAFVTELELGHETVDKHFGSSIHFLLLPKPENIKFAAIIPKGRYATLCIIGEDINKETVTSLLNTPAARKLLPENMISEKNCKCFPKLSLEAAKVPFANRVVIIGDAGSTRLFKDGIGAAYIMGKSAAVTAVLQGVGKEDFTKHYLPAYNSTRVDNMFGKFIYQTTCVYKNIGILTEGMLNVVKEEQKNKDMKFARLSSILWDTFTGNETYKNIFMRGANPWMHLKLVMEFIKIALRKIL